MPELAAVVLAAGLGTRLRPLTEFRPKALCPVANVPLIDWALTAVAPYATDPPNVAVNAHHRVDDLAAHLGDRVHLSVELPEPLGTAGALGRLRPWIAGRHTLLVNADSWRAGSLERLVNGWDGERMRLLCVRDAQRWDFNELRYAGVALLPWSVVAQLEDRVSGLYETCWAPAFANDELDLVATSEAFFDCGTPRDYLLANLAANGGESVIGPGADVAGELVRSVVWPHGVVRVGERLIEAVRVGSDVTVDCRARG